MKKPKLTTDQKARRRIAKKVAAKNAKARADVGPLFVDQAPLVNFEDEYWKWRKVKAAGGGGGEGAAELALVDYRWTMRLIRAIARQCLDPDTYAWADQHRWHGDDIQFWKDVLIGRGRYVVSYWRHVYGCKSFEHEDGTIFVEKRVEVGEALVWPPAGWVPPLTREQFDRLIAAPVPLDHPGAVDPLRLA